MRPVVDETSNPATTAWQSLAEGIANGAYAFVGAGASRGLGYPMWGSLLKHLHDECVKRGIDAARLETIKDTNALVQAHMYELALTRPQVLEEIRKLYSLRAEKTSPLHDAIIKVGFDHFLTTNYDLLLESSHESSGIKTRSLELKQAEVLKFLRATHSHKGFDKTVLHIHGKVDQLDSVVLALNDYREVYGKSAATQAVLGNLLLTKSFVFIGYSLSDPPLNSLLDHVKSLNGDSESPQHWMIMAKPPNDAAKRLELNHQYNIEPVFYDNADGTHSELLPLIQKLAKAVCDFRSQNGQLVVANVLDGVFGAGAMSLTRQQADERARVISLPAYQGVLSTGSGAEQKTAWDHRIDAQVELLKNGFFEQARQNFLELLRELPSDAEPRLRYRLNANVGHALVQLERRKEVIPYYEEAYRCAPDKADAKWMHALVAEFQGDFPEAVARAERLCNEEPEYARGHSIRIRCAPLQTPLIDLKRSTPRSIRRDAEVSSALSEAADRREEWRAGEAYARNTARVAPDWEHAHMIVGASIMKRELGGDQPVVDYHVVPINRSRVEEAGSWFSKAIGILLSQPPRPHLAAAYVNRAGVRRLLGDDDGAHQDATDAYRILPNDVKVITKYAHSLEARDELDESIRVIESSADALKFTPARFMRLLAITRRKKENYLSTAVPEALALANTPDLDAIESADAHALLCRLMLRQQSPDKVLEHMRKLDASALPSGLRDARLAAYIFRYESKDSEEVVTLLTNAIIAGRSTAPWFARREIAHICAMLGRYRDAADIMATIISPRLFNEETEEYLESLLRSNQYASVREYCKALRNYGQYTEAAMHSDCDALYFSGELKEAIDLLTDWLAWRPDDKRAWLHRSNLCVARGDVTDAAFDPALFPTVDEIQRPYDGIQVVRVLLHGPDPEVGREYAFRLARKYPDDEGVQHQFVMALMLGATPEPSQSHTSVVAMRHTITLRNRDGNERRTVKLIDDHIQTPDEFLPTHEVARSLLGKKVGDSITFGQEEMIIESVTPSAAIAAQNAMEHFHIRFPNSLLIQKFTPRTSPENATTAREILGDEWWQMATSDDEANAHAFRLYQNAEVPLTVVAHRRGRSTFETALFVVNSTEHDVLSVPEIPNADPTHFINKCFDVARTAQTVVLDATVLATILSFGMVDELAKIPFKLIVPDSVLQEVRKVQLESESGRGEHRAGLRDGQFFMIETSPQAISALAASLKHLADTIQSVCEVVGGSARERVAFENKEAIASAVGQSAFDSIAIARDRNAVLWTDDQMLGRIAHDLCKVSPIWTQALLHLSDTRARMKWFDKRLSGGHLPEFLLHRFRGTLVFVGDIALSLQLCDWNLEISRLAGLRRFLKEFGCEPRNFDSTRTMFVAMWVNTPARDRSKVTRAIWTILNSFDRDIAKAQIARVLYRPQNSKLKRITPAYSRFRNIFRIWACSPQTVEQMLKRRTFS